MTWQAADDRAGRRLRRRAAAADRGRPRPRSRRRTPGGAAPHRARGLRGVDQRRAGRRRRAQPRVEQLRVAAALPQLRRHRPACGRDDASSASRSATGGSGAGSAGPGGARVLRRSSWRALAQLEIDFDDGHRQIVGHGRPLAAGPSAVIVNDLYDGQTIDARRRRRTEHRRVGGRRLVDFDTARARRPYVGPPVAAPGGRCGHVRIWTSPSGRTLVDFGQNLVGWLRLSVQRRGRSTITVRHAEVLEDGELGVRPLRTAQGDRPVRPERRRRRPSSRRFTFHGFRYAEVDGWPGELTADDARGGRRPLRAAPHRRLRVLRPAAQPAPPTTSSGACAATSVDVPTDCPQRDERLGWTGDLAVFAPDRRVPLRRRRRSSATGCSTSPLEQEHADGRVAVRGPGRAQVTSRPSAPEGMPAPDTAAIWSDAAVWVPWALWQAYGDGAVLATSTPSMARARPPGRAGLLTPTGCGTTASSSATGSIPTAPPDQPCRRQGRHGRRRHRRASTARAARRPRRPRSSAGTTTPSGSTQLAAADACGRSASTTSQTTARSAATRPTVYALAIVFGLLDGADRQRAGDRLAELVAAERLPHRAPASPARRSSPTRSP